MKMKNKNTRRGFTLIELLVVVLIIGVLTSVAVPQYQKAVLKSRFSTVMPVAKAIADGNEVFYQGRGYYANNVDELDIQALSADTNATVELASIEKSESGFDYVLARRSDVPGLAYIIYQSHSEQFPGTIMCEANDTLNPKASELCEKVLQGRAVSNGSLQGDNWKAYLLAGEQGSSKFTSCMGAKPAPIVAGQSRATGTATCNEKTGEYEYSTWENGRTYSAYSECKANGVSYACAGATFTGNFSKCEGDAANACAGSTFQQQAYCLGKIANACADTTYTGRFSYCLGQSEDACNGAHFMGNYSYCYGYARNACRGAIIEASSFCQSDNPNSCDGAIYPEDENGRKGCCRAISSNYPCPTGAPKCNDSSYPTWDGTYW